MMKWNELNTADRLTVAIPLDDGTYSIQSSEVIQIKSVGEKLSYLFLKFKYTDPDGKRQRCQCYVPDSNMDVETLFLGNYKNLVRELEPDTIIVSCAQENEQIHQAILDLMTSIVNKLEAHVEETQKRISLIKEKYAI